MNRVTKARISVFVPLGLVLLGAITGAVNYALRVIPETIPAEDNIVVTAVTLREGDNRKTVRARGKIIPNRKTVVSAEVTGTILHIEHYLGAHVGENETILEIDSSDLSEQVRSIEAQIRKAEIDSGLKEGLWNERRRAVGLPEGAFDDPEVKIEDFLGGELYGVVELRETWGHANAAKAELDRLSAELGRLKLRLDDCTLKAPFSGYVTDMVVEVGQFVSPGMTLFTLQDFSTALVEVGLAEPDAVSVAIGDPARIHVDSQGRTFDADVLRMSPAPDAGRRYKVQLRIRDSFEESVLPELISEEDRSHGIETRKLPALFEGLSAGVEIVTDVFPNSIAVPRNAVVRRTMGRLAIDVPDGGWLGAGLGEKPESRQRFLLMAKRAGSQSSEEMVSYFAHVERARSAGSGFRVEAVVHDKGARGLPRVGEIRAGDEIAVGTGVKFSNCTAASDLVQSPELVIFDVENVWNEISFKIEDEGMDDKDRDYAASSYLSIDRKSVVDCYAPLDEKLPAADNSGKFRSYFRFVRAGPGGSISIDAFAVALEPWESFEMKEARASVIDIHTNREITRLTLSGKVSASSSPVRGGETLPYGISKARVLIPSVETELRDKFLLQGVIDGDTVLTSGNELLTDGAIVKVFFE
ncbi:MAG: efflux RND transporter periplasmic adaptor subunit [Planctomycetes bacterium]|nr:efflux RND transporter periplasmic adaptor subunit [Planctomycetota bacterium]